MKSEIPSGNSEIGMINKENWVHHVPQGEQISEKRKYLGLMEHIVRVRSFRDQS